MLYYTIQILYFWKTIDTQKGITNPVPKKWKSKKVKV